MNAFKEYLEQVKNTEDKLGGAGNIAADCIKVCNSPFETEPHFAEKPMSKLFLKFVLSKYSIPEDMQNEIMKNKNTKTSIIDKVKFTLSGKIDDILKINNREFSKRDREKALEYLKNLTNKRKDRK